MTAHNALLTKNHGFNNLALVGLVIVSKRDVGDASCRGTTDVHYRLESRPQKHRRILAKLKIRVLVYGRGGRSTEIQLFSVRLALARFGKRIAS